MIQAARVQQFGDLGDMRLKRSEPWKELPISAATSSLTTSFKRPRSIRRSIGLRQMPASRR
jgi:hypothetical protein